MGRLPRIVSRVICLTAGVMAWACATPRAMAPPADAEAPSPNVPAVGVHAVGVSAVNTSPETGSADTSPILISPGIVPQTANLQTETADDVASAAVNEPIESATAVGKPAVGAPTPNAPPVAADASDAEDPADVTPLEGTWMSGTIVYQVRGSRLRMFSPQNPDTAIDGTLDIAGDQLTVRTNNQSETFDFRIKGQWLVLTDAAGIDRLLIRDDPAAAPPDGGIDGEPWLDPRLIGSWTRIPSLRGPRRPPDVLEIGKDSSWSHVAGVAIPPETVPARRTGKCRTENGTVMVTIDGENDGAWRVFSQYSVNEDSLVFVYTNGRREFWTRK